jgi:Holliday junction resolvase-like predicted endonuclease
MNIGEEIVAAYLEHIKGCEFIQRNLDTRDVQGEIDIVGIDLHNNKVYICEVAIHLPTGLQYNKGSVVNNVDKLTEKFSRDIDYANKYLSKYQKHYMLWSPIIKKGKEGAKHCQEKDLIEIATNIKQLHGVDIEFIVKGKFLCCLDELRAYAKTQTREIKSPIIRLYQIEEELRKKAYPV